MIKYGSTRMVIIVGKYAIKMPYFNREDMFYGGLCSFLSGWKGNRYEYIWSNANIKQMLNYPLNKTVLSLFGSLIVIQRTVTPLTVDEFLYLDKVNFGGYEHKIDSFGWLDGTVVIIDYDGRSICS